jgi:hypothetical protein
VRRNEQEHRQPLRRAGNAVGGRSCFRAALAHDLRGANVEIVQPEDSGESLDADDDEGVEDPGLLCLGRIIVCILDRAKRVHTITGGC